MIDFLRSFDNLHRTISLTYTSKAGLNWPFLFNFRDWVEGTIAPWLRVCFQLA